MKRAPFSQKHCRQAAHHARGAKTLRPCQPTSNRSTQYTRHHARRVPGVHGSAIKAATDWSPLWRSSAVSFSPPRAQRVHVNCVPSLRLTRSRKLCKGRSRTFLKCLRISADLKNVAVSIRSSGHLRRDRGRCCLRHRRLARPAAEDPTWRPQKTANVGNTESRNRPDRAELGSAV